MPLPMVHLAIAVRLHEGRGPAPDFLLGSIAPDAIHMREGASREDKRLTHLPAGSGEAEDAPARALFAQYEHTDRDTADFAAGYVAHVLTDRVWRDTFYATFRSRVAPDLDPAEWRRLYYRETDQLDFNLYRRMPWRPEVWTRLALAQPRDFADLLTGAEIGRWRDRTLHWFEDPAKDPRIEPSYCTDQELQGFISHAADVVANRFAAWRAGDGGTR